MNQIMIYKDNQVGITIVPNLFIDEYMKDANDAQLKVYLYLLRMISQNQSTSISDMADLFNHTEKDVLRALKYWETRNLLTLRFDEQGNLSGIFLGEVGRTSDIPAVPVVSAPIASISYINTSANSSAKVAACSQQNTVETVVSVSAPAKVSLTLDELRTFKNTDACSRLVFLAESYLGKTLSSGDLHSLYYLHTTLSLNEDLIDSLLQYCVEKGKREFRYIEKVACSWWENDIKTTRQASALMKSQDKVLLAVQKALGRKEDITPAELEYIYKWSKTYSTPLELIVEACNRAALATQRRRIEYADSILTDWYKKNIRSLAQVQEADANFRKASSPDNRTSTKAAATNKFNQFAQNSYDFDQLEQEILSN